MELFDNLASVGLTTNVLQIIIISAIVIFIVGMYWRYIVIGVGLVFCIAVFAMPSKKAEVQQVAAVTPPVVQEWKPEEPKQAKPEEPKPPVAQMTPDQEMFMEDCKLYGGMSQSECALLWRERENDFEAVKWRKQWKKDYMKRVKYGRV